MQVGYLRFYLYVHGISTFMTVRTGLEQRPTQVIWIAFDAECRAEEGHILA